MEWHLKDSDKSALLSLARTSLESYFDTAQDKALSDFEKLTLPSHPALKEKMACFVSLHTHSKRLRGCVGILSTDDPLYENVAHYTVQAAMADPRFSPVKKNELGAIVIGISVLGPSEILLNTDDLVIGKHGLVISSGNRRGVLLAKVALEEKWDREEFIAQTCLKAGLAPEMQSHYEKHFFEEISFGEEK
jgi:uncharacterized protein